MTAAVPFSQPHRATTQPGDAARVPDHLTDQPGPPPRERRPPWKPVWIRIDGTWRGGLLHVWRLLPNGTWACYVQHGGGPRDNGWYLPTPDTLRPIPEPGTDLPAQPSRPTVSP